MNCGRDYVQVVTDGVKTLGQMLDSLYSVINLSKITPFTKLVLGTTVFNVAETSMLTFYYVHYIDSSIIEIGTIKIASSNSKYTRGQLRTAPSVWDASTGVPSAGTTYRLYY